MQGLMMDRPLLISSLIEYAAEVFPRRRIVSRRVEGDIHRYGYRDARDRASQLAHALKDLGIVAGDRVATLAWNGHRHFELYYAISGIGAVCHTINPRLFRDQLIYIVNHAEDRLLFIDTTFVRLVEDLIGELPSLEAVVILADEAHMPDTALPRVLCYEHLLEGRPTSFDWPEFDENSAAGLCYTSGTTGHPKGALYSHRSNVLHALSNAAFDGVRCGADENFLPVVPLFHVNAWGLPYTAALTGTALTFPGPKLDGASLFDLMDGEGVTSAWGVPTVWLGLLDEMRRRGAKPKSLRWMVVGGAAPPRSMIAALEKDYGIEVLHGWGMTEMSPVGSVCLLDEESRDWPRERQLDLKTKQGRRLYQVEMKIIDDDGRALAHDGTAAGELLVRGPFIARAYFRDEAASAAALDPDGWFRTGDVATIDSDGYMQVVDRSKDMIKSGGEWISSIDLENQAMAHPDVAEAAAIAAAHPKWGERPLLVVVPRDGAELDRAAVLAFLKDKMPRWCLPDDVVFADELPHTATGKIAKRELRQRYKDHRLPTA